MFSYYNGTIEKKVFHNCQSNKFSVGNPDFHLSKLCLFPSSPYKQITYYQYLQKSEFFGGFKSDYLVLKAHSHDQRMIIQL